VVTARDLTPMLGPYNLRMEPAFTKPEGSRVVTPWLPSACSMDETLQVFLVQRWDRTFLKCCRKHISLIF